jgi:transmembrane sensor
MVDGQDPDREDELFTEANRWFFRLQAEDVSPAEKQEFSEWLNADAAHSEAWKNVHALMHSLRAPAQASYDARLAAGRGQWRRRPAPRGRVAPAKRKAPRVLAACLALIVGLIAYVQGPVLLDRWTADHVTVAGERATLTLADGTHVDLDSDTALKTDITAGERRVTVLRGEAFFQIAPDARPFVVTTRDGEARDIGTAFSITRRDGRSIATVETGIVDVKATSGPGATVRLMAGDSVDYGRGSVSPLRKADLDQDLAWRRGQIIFRQERLSDVVTKLNRYRSGRIVIVNPWVSGELVSGTFDIDRPEAPVDALETVLGVKATYLTPYLVVLR